MSTSSFIKQELGRRGCRSVSKVIFKVISNSQHFVFLSLIHSRSTLAVPEVVSLRKSALPSAQGLFGEEETDAYLLPECG